MRSMYFAVSGLMKVFRFLHYGLALVLILVGLKMITADYFLVPTLVTLGLVGGVLLLSIAASIALPAKSQ
jgi:tellurite resistance protein TerC